MTQFYESLFYWNILLFLFFAFFTLIFDLFPLIVVLQQHLVLSKELNRVVPLMSERIFEFAVRFLVLLHQTFRDQAAVQYFSNSLFVQIFANEDDFNPLVAVGFLPILANELCEAFQFFFIVDPLVFGHFDVPRLLYGVDNSHACFMHQELIARVVRQPEEALGACNLFPEGPVLLLGDECVEFLRIEGPPLAINEARYVVLDGFRDIFSGVLLSDPPLAYFCLLKIEAFLEDQLQIDVRIGRLKDFGLRVDPLDIGVYSSFLLLADEVSFVYNDQISDLELVQHQLSNRWLFLFFHLLFLSPAPASSRFAVILFVFFLHHLIRDQILLEVFCVDDRHHRIDLCVFFYAWSVSEGLSNWERSGHPCSLDHKIVELLGFGQLLHLFNHIVLQSAADAPVAHLKDVLMLLYLKGMVLDQVGINVHLTYVVQDNSHLEPFAVSENVLHKCSLPGAQKA